MLITGFFSAYSYGQQSDTMTYINPDIQPTFKYDTCSNMLSSLKKYFIYNYKMPDILLDNGYGGSVYVELIIEKDSAISNIKLKRGIDTPLDKSVLERIQTMPKWCPGNDKGKTVRSRVTIPVSIHWLYGKTE